MLTKNELERRDYLASIDLSGTLAAAGMAKPSGEAKRLARRLRRQRRESVDTYRRPSGWSVRLW